MSSLKGLCMRIVLDSFQWSGVVPVIHRQMKRLCIADWRACGRIFKRAFGMSSGPGDLSF